MKLASLLLSCLLLLQSIPVWSSDTKISENLIVKLDVLTKNFEKNCLSDKVKDVELHFKQYGLSENCWQMLTEINHKETELSKLHPELNDTVSCTNCNKSTPLVNLPSLHLNQGPTCSSKVAKENLNNCPGDLACSLVSTMTTFPFFEKQLVTPDKLLPKGMNPGRCQSNDSCTNQIATAFIKSITKFITGAWDLLVSASGYAKDKIGDFWKWVTDAEDSSSAAQLALAQASENEGLFQMFRKDFWGTTSNIFQGLISGIKSWLKEDILCEKWQGRAHHSKCLSPAKGFECISCKSMVNGICAISGVFISEILPSFVTGGLVTAAKHGMNATAHFITKTFKVSDKAIETIKASKAMKSSLGVAASVEKVTKVGTILSKINQYFLSPARKIAKTSFKILSALARNSKSYIAQTTTGKYIVFAQDGLKIVGKVALYPIENNMTIMSYKLGQRTFDKAFKTALPSLANKTSVATAVTLHTPQLETVLTKIEIDHLRGVKTLDLEKEQVRILQGKRNALTTRAFATKNPEFPEVIRTIYPELNYGQLAKATKAQDILKLEKDLYLEITKVKSPELKKKMLHQYQKLIVESKQRKSLLKDQPNYKEIVDNSNLSAITRGARGIQLTGKIVLNTAQRKHLEEGIRNAMNFSWSKKQSILEAAGFSPQEAQKLMKFGIVGMPPN